jgi:hypothetical protein
MDLSPGTLIASMLVSTVGFGFFLYGKKQVRLPQLATGVVLMAYPYFVGGAALVIGIGAGIVLALWLALRAGI